MSYGWVGGTTPLDMTSVTDGRTHAIAAADFDACPWAGQGRYRAIFGAQVIAAAMVSAPGPQCPVRAQPAAGVEHHDSGSIKTHLASLPVPGSSLPAEVRCHRLRVGVPGALPRLSSAELIAAGVRAELLESLALRRALSGRVATMGDQYYDHGFPMPSFLAQTCNELTEAGLLSLAEDAWGMLRLGISDAGRNRYAQLNALGPVARPGRPGPSAEAAPAPGGVKVCGSVLARVAGERYECAQAPGHDSGPDPTPCTDAEKTISW